MLRSKVLHKHKKLCFVLPIIMERDHNIKPGTLFRVKNQVHLNTLKCDVDNDKIVCTPPEQGYLKFVLLEKDTYLMYIDVIYDPYVKAHFLRFLANNAILGLRFTKGITLSSLSEDFDRFVLEEES